VTEETVFHPAKEFPKKKKVYFVSTVTGLLLLLFVIGLLYRLILWEEWKEARPVQEPLAVKTMVLEEGNRVIELTLPSIAEGIHVTPIWGRVDGYVQDFYADIGDHVKEGQLLAIIETPELDRQVEELKAELASTEAQLGLAQITAERWEALYKKNPKAISLQEVEEKQAFYASLLANRESASSNLERLKKLQEFNHLIAPFDGIITVRNLDIGTLVTAGSIDTIMQLFQIAKTDVIRAFVDVPQTFFRLIQPGEKADVLIKEFPGRVFNGWVARTSESLDPMSRTLLTEVHVINEDGALITGLYTDVKFHLIPNEPTFIIPTTALVIREGPPQVAVLNETNVVHLQNVTIGRDYGKSIEIVWGLNEGEKIVTNPTDRIREGTQVTVKNG